MSRKVENVWIMKLTVIPILVDALRADSGKDADEVENSETVQSKRPDQELKQREELADHKVKLKEKQKDKQIPRPC